MAAPFKERAVVGARLDDLDEKRLAAYFRARFPAWSPPDDWAPALEAHKLAVAADSGTVPTCLGLLLFTDAPERFVNGAFIDLASYKHGDPDGEAADSVRIAGPLPEQIVQALAYPGFLIRLRFEGRCAASAGIFRVARSPPFSRRVGAPVGWRRVVRFGDVSVVAGKGELCAASGCGGG